MFNHQDYCFSGPIKFQRLEKLVQEMKDNHYSNENDAGNQDVVRGANNKNTVL